ncbi:MAG: hypothetical protein NC320_00110 [Clostridium sp.]|nr:hypothetical protein [Clostridium sp.]MCM1547950.1 hypothetical protein [Ruminococcus sp.]
MLGSLIFDSIKQFDLDKHEVISLYITGIDIGILTKDDLYDYILTQIESCGKPDALYCEIALELHKDWKILRSILLGILHNEGYVYGYEQHVDRAYYTLVEIVGRRFESGELSLKETVHLFYVIANAFNQYYDDLYSDLIFLEDDYEWAEEGSGTMTDIEANVKYILEKYRRNIKKWQQH